MDIKKVLFSAKSKVENNYKLVLNVISYSLVAIYSIITAISYIVAFFSLGLFLFVLVFIIYMLYFCGLFKLIKVIYVNFKSIK